MSREESSKQGTFTSIIDMTNLEAKAYFREKNHYVNFDLPPYFDFDDVLLYAHSMTTKKNLADLCIKDSGGKPKYPGSYQDVNYVILSNKDGGFAWRPMQIIHPVLYSDLVNIMTEKNSWQDILKLFERQKHTDIECISMPLKSHTNGSNRAVQITNWWDNRARITQESTRL